MNSSIKNWYVEKYPTDDLGQEIPENLTFYDVYEALEFRQSVYALLGGADDSIIRERIFEKLAELMRCENLNIIKEVKAKKITSNAMKIYEGQKIECEELHIYKYYN